MPAWAAPEGYAPHYVTSIKILVHQYFILVTLCGAYPAGAAQAGIKLPPTLEADKPVWALQLHTTVPYLLISKCPLKLAVYLYFSKN